MSFYTRVMAAEVCFGDVDQEEANIAYSILSSVMKVRTYHFKRICVVGS